MVQSPLWRLNLVWKTKFNLALVNVSTLAKMMYTDGIQSQWLHLFGSILVTGWERVQLSAANSKSGENNLLFPLWKTAALVFYRILNRTWFSRRTDEPPTRNFHRSNRRMRIFLEFRCRLRDSDFGNEEWKKNTSSVLGGRRTSHLEIWFLRMKIEVVGNFSK